MSLNRPELPVAVIGAGPIGLAAAAHLVARGYQPLVIEAGAGIAAHLESYRHVRLFSPWRYNLDPAATALLKQTGWREPALDELPTAGDIVDRYLAPLAQQPGIAMGLQLRTRVVAISREGFDRVKTKGRELAPFVLQVETPEGPRQFHASAVIDASGTWGTPNPLGANGLAAPGEAALRDRIEYGMPDVLGALRDRYAGKRVLVIGSGHSALGSLLALAELADHAPQTRIAWAIRGNNLAKIFGGGENDGFAARGALGRRLRKLHESGRLALHANFRVRALLRGPQGIDVLGEGSAAIAGVDEIIAATGARPDLSLARELRTRLDHWLESTEALAPLIDPNVHSCGTVRPHGFRELSHPETGFFIVGAKSYGRAPNFLMATGYEQVRSIVAALAGDLKAAEDVQLELPETGVCSTDFAEAPAGAAGCCGGPAPAGVEACCVADAEAKAAGDAGCGCGPAQPAVAAVAAPRAAAGCGPRCG
jgi:cation diffusion facilitator CzcD-associated flavoprotein CzcO